MLKSTACRASCLLHCRVGVIGVTKRGIFKSGNPIGSIAEKIDEVNKRADLKRDMSIGTGVLVAKDVYKNPELKLIEPQLIAPRTDFPLVNPGGVVLNMKLRRFDFDSLIRDRSSYKFVIAIEKRHAGVLMTNHWRQVLNKNFPTIKVVELIIVHQITHIIFFPLFYMTFLYRIFPDAFDDTIVRLGPCRHLMRDIKLQNPYVPNVYLVDPTGKACWISSCAPTEEDVDQLNNIFSYGSTRKPKKKTNKKKPQPGKKE